MTMQEAIHIVAEDAAKYRGLAVIAEDMTRGALDKDGTSSVHAQEYRNRAQALDMLLRVARAFERTGEE